MVVLDFFKSPKGGLDFHQIGVLDFLFPLNGGLGNIQKGFWISKSQLRAQLTGWNVSSAGKSKVRSHNLWDTLRESSPLTQRCTGTLTQTTFVIEVFGLYMYRYTNYEIGVWNSIKRGFELFIHTLGVSDIIKRGLEPFIHTIVVWTLKLRHWDWLIYSDWFYNLFTQKCLYDVHLEHKLSTPLMSVCGMVRKLNKCDIVMFNNCDVVMWPYSQIVHV